MTRYKLHVLEWSIGENVIEVQLRLYWSAMPASSTENATTSLENLHGIVNEVSCHFKKNDSLSHVGKREFRMVHSV